jgi:hypothetical protein
MCVGDGCNASNILSKHVFNIDKVIFQVKLRLLGYLIYADRIIKIKIMFGSAKNSNVHTYSDAICYKTGMYNTK